MERWTPTADAARGGDQAAAGQHLSAPARSPDGERGRRMVRYADDFVVLCRTRAEAEAALREVQAWVAENGLTPAPGQDACRRLPAAGAGLRVPRLPVRSRPAAGSQEEPEGAQGQSEKPDDPHRAATAWRGSSATSTRRLRGWFGYFKHAHAARVPRPSTASSDDGCAPSCASRRSGPASDDATPTINAGPMPSSRRMGCSPYRQPMHAARHSR